MLLIVFPEVQIFSRQANVDITDAHIKSKLRKMKAWFALEDLESKGCEWANHSVT
jgi:hypothetical protein